MSSTETRQEGKNRLAQQTQKLLPEWKRARIATSAFFFIDGAMFANWATRIPDRQMALGLSERGLGLVLMGIAAGVVTALLLASGLIARYGSKRITAGGSLLFVGMLPLLALAPTPLILWISLFLFGASISVSDVAKNAQAIEIERRYGRPIMTSFHAIFSVGGGVGALMGSAMAGLGIGVLTHFLIVSAILIAITLPAIRHLLSNIEGEGKTDGPAITLPLPALWPLGAVAFAAALAEGAMADWSTVYMTSIVMAASGVAGLGYAAFSIMMTVGRASGDALTARIAPSTLVRFGGLIAAIGLAAAALIPAIPVTLLGFALVGIGLSTVIPLAFSAAGNMPGIPSGTGIASVATIGYSGFLAGPPIIGLIAQATSLQIAFGFVALLAATLFITAQSMRKAQPLDVSA